MSSLILPGLVVFWAALSAWAAHAASPLVAGRHSRRIFSLVGLLACLPLPLLDELLAEPAFRELCRTEAGWFPQGPASQGAPVRIVERPPQPVGGLALPVTLRERVHQEALTGTVVGTERWLQAGGDCAA